MSLQVDNLRRTFGEKVAVDNLSFSMQEPGVFGLIGTNGAGKSTTIRMILGILRPDSGTAIWNGKPITRETLGFGYMPEERGIYMKNKVGEQLIYFGMLRGMSKSNAQASAGQLCKRLGISEYYHMNAEKLSKGNQQKVQLAATLIHNPSLVFLDEPFSGLDPVNTELLRTLIGELVNEGKFIIMSSHQMPVIEDYCRDIVILDHGKSVLTGNLRKIKAGYGHTKLRFCANTDCTEIAKRCGLTVTAERADETEYSIHGDDMAYAFLQAVMEAGIRPIKFEIAEPSLNEIFLEKTAGGILS